MNKALSFLLSSIRKIELAVCFLGLAVSTGLIFAAVANRYWLHLEIMWLNDLAQYSFVFFMFLAFAVTTREEGHVAVNIFPDKIFHNRPVGRAIYNIFLRILSLAIFCILLPVVYKFMLRAIKYPEYGTLVRWFNTSWLQIGLFFSFILVLIHMLILLQEDIIKYIKISKTHYLRKRN